MKDHAHILLVDDDESSREALSLLLKASGYLVTPAPSGTDAIRHLNTTPFDLVITDLAMPKMSGVDVLRVPGRAADFSGAPVSADTSRAMPYTDRQWPRLGVSLRVKT